MTQEAALQYQAQHCQQTLIHVAQRCDPQVRLMLALMALYR